jgi:hypothetical protein
MFQAKRVGTCLLLLGCPILATILGGCASAEQVAAQRNLTCQSYGMQFGTPEYADCRMQLAQIQQAQQAEAIRRFGQALSNSGNCSNMAAGQAFACGYAAGSR